MGYPGSGGINRGLYNEDEVSGVTVHGTSGGVAEEYGFTVQSSDETGVVIGFSFSGTTVPEGEHTLTTLLVTGDPNTFSIGSAILSDADGNTLDASIDGNGFIYCSADVEYDGICDGTYSLQEGGLGTWQITCSNNMGAAGTLKWVKDGGVTGIGRDHNDKKVKFTVSKQS